MYFCGLLTYNINAMKQTKKHLFLLISVTVAFLVSTIVPNVAYAQKAVFSNCKLEHNVKDKNGKKMMKCHFSAKFTGMKGHNIDIFMMVESPKGTLHEYLDDDYGGDGRLRLPVESVKTFTNKNKSNNCSLTNKTISLYNKDIHPKKGKHTYYVHLIAYDAETYEELGVSEYMKFTMTGK